MTCREAVEMLERTRAFVDDTGRDDRTVRVIASAQLRALIFGLSGRDPGGCYVPPRRPATEDRS